MVSKNNRTRGRTKKHRRRGRSSLGGEAIAAGGYGCVFKPALKCRLGSKRTTGISKLMYARYAMEEMEEVARLRPIILTIPNYEKYFIIHDIDICDPAPLTASDLKNMKICNNFKNHNPKLVTKDNINRVLDELKIINIPYGGIDLYKWMSVLRGRVSEDDKVTLLATLNKKMMGLINYAIVPMNKKKLFHFDLKAQNILVDDELNLRIIDWGLSAVQTGTQIPNIVMNRPFQFNVPFSNTLFSPHMQHWLDEEFAVILPTVQHNSDLTQDIYREKLKIIAYNFIGHIRTERGNGHFSVITDLMGVYVRNHYLFGVTNEEFYDALTKNIIADYLATIFDEYILDGQFQQENYFNEVYKHNVDIWGALSVYTDVLIETSTSNIPDKHGQQIQEQFQIIIIKYMYSSTFAAKKIPVNELLHDMNNINVLLGKTTVIASLRAPKANTTKRVQLTKHNPNLGAPPGFAVIKQESEKKQAAAPAAAAPAPAAAAPAAAASNRRSFSWAGKRCPKGTHRNKKTKKCERKK